MATSTVKSTKRSRESDIGSVELEEPNVASASTSQLPSNEQETGPLTTQPKKKKKKDVTSGIVYISRLPPGMTPQKIRHLMARWGDLGKLYAQPKDAVTSYNPNGQHKKKQKHQNANYSEAWVEFLDKSVAKTVASMLNAQVIGGKKGDKWRDDIWTMKYLSGFKWEMLGEQMAYEKQAHQARLRAEISRSKTEQGEYLKNVDLARQLEKRNTKKAAAGESGNAAPSTGDDTKASRGYKQRQVVEKSKTLEGQGMDGVLGNIFG
ncbi:hypothetical protein B9479_006035 [Cryptococcus floricola]|uniref:18S rRNA factor 2 n=1 Tax=Cryptococcus floricola TaxID=2591691 RepID=A0A5D3ATC6_9TREE|nr:hypothetical protein B9479_006035 [Cryptococcus floricola]